MKRVLAAIDNSAAARPVLASAQAIAPLYNATVGALHVREDGADVAAAEAETVGIELELASGPPVEAILAAAARPEVRAVTVGARGTPGGRRPVGSTALELITAVRKPILVVPPEVVEPEIVDAVLVPLDGTEITAKALAETIQLARGSGLRVVVLHVREEAALQAFSDQPQHEMRAWADEFLARYCACPPGEVDLELRVGIPRQQVADVIREVGADVLTLGWSQDLSRGHAAVVREALGRSPVPVLLVPIAAE